MFIPIDHGNIKESQMLSMPTHTSIRFYFYLVTMAINVTMSVDTLQGIINCISTM